MNELDLIFEVAKLPLAGVFVAMMFWALKKLVDTVKEKDQDVKTAWTTLLTNQASMLEKHVESLTSVRLALAEQSGATRALGDQFRSHAQHVETMITEVLREVRKDERG